MTGSVQTENAHPDEQRRKVELPPQKVKILKVRLNDTTIKLKVSDLTSYRKLIELIEINFYLDPKQV